MFTIDNLFVVFNSFKNIIIINIIIIIVVVVIVVDIIIIIIINKLFVPSRNSLYSHNFHNNYLNNICMCIDCLPLLYTGTLK